MGAPTLGRKVPFSMKGQATLGDAFNAGDTASSTDPAGTAAQPPDSPFADDHRLNIGSILSLASQFTAIVTTPINQVLDHAKRCPWIVRGLRVDMPDVTHDNSRCAMHRIISGVVKNAEQLLRRCDDKLAEMDDKLELHKSELEGLIAVHEKHQNARDSVMSCADLSWVCQTSSGNAFCDVCGEFGDRLPVGSISGSGRRSNWIKANGGVVVSQDPRDFKRSACRHAASELHTACIEAKRELEQARRLDDTLDSIGARELSTMETLFNVLHFQIEQHRSQRSYEAAVHLLDKCLCDVGHKEHSRKTYVRFFFAAPL